MKIAVFDGQNADISNGHVMGDGIKAHTPWGEIAYRLGGKNGYKKIDDSIGSSAPGADTIRELLGDGPVLVLLDELAVYLRMAEVHEVEGKQLVGRQFVVFLTTLIKAVESSPNAALVYTLAESDAGDAYSEENRRLVTELKSAASRKATLTNPTEEGETIQILRRRLFEHRDESRVDEVINAYKKVWKYNRGRLSDEVEDNNTIKTFKAGYPLHPDILDTLVSKTSTLQNFQRVRGMLRLLGHVVHDMWEQRNELKPAAIHMHHFDFGNESINQEITTRLKQDEFASAITTDIACNDEDKTSLAQRLDKKYYPNMPPFTTYIARTLFMHTLAYNPQLKGIMDKKLRYSILMPGMEIGYIDEALERFKDRSQYLDDNANERTRFQSMPNLNQAIPNAERSLDDEDLEAEIDKRIGKAFENGEFDRQLFPTGYEDIPDTDGKPQLIIPRYSTVSASNPELPPTFVSEIFRKKGIGGIRVYRNNLVFLVAHKDGVEPMYEKARRYLALENLSVQDRMTDFTDSQRRDVQEKKKLRT